MDKRALYLCLYQAVCHDNGDAQIQNVRDFARTLEVSVSRNSNQQISLITLEFSGLKSRFPCVLAFDGLSDASISANGFMMPMARLNPRQRTLCLLSCLYFLHKSELIQIDWPVVLDRVCTEFGQGAIGIQHQFDRQLQRAIKHAQVTDVQDEVATSHRRPTNYCF